MNISSIIGELLFHHNKLVIPGFGTFYIQHRSAELNKATQVLNPPTREVNFNDQKPSDDGVLSGYIRKKFRLQDKEISEAIVQLVSSWEQQLAKDGKAPVADLGIFKKEGSGKVIFIADEIFMKKVNLFDMPRFSIPAVQKTPAIVKPLPVVPKKEEKPKQRKRTWIPVTVVIVIAGLAASVYFTGVYKKTDRLIFGTRNVTETEPLKADTSAEISRQLDRQTARQQALSLEEQEAKPSIKDESAVNSVIEPTEASSGLKYHIIAGSFLVPNNADRLKEKLEEQGLVSVQLVQQRDYFMVSVGSFASKDKANAAMNEVRKKLKQQLWILKI